MPRVAVTRQQQMQERIILAQTPAWLADPASSTATLSSPPAQSVSLLKRVTDASPSSPTHAASSLATRPDAPSPTGSAIGVADCALYEQFKKPVGRVVATSPFPAHHQMHPAPVSKTPPPQLAIASTAASPSSSPNNKASSPTKANSSLTSAPALPTKGVSSPPQLPASSSSKAVGFRGGALEAEASASTNASASPPRGMLTVDRQPTVVHGAPPRMQGLSAILNGPLPKSAPTVMSPLSPQRRLAPMSRQGTSNSGTRSNLPSRQSGPGMLLSSSYTAGPDASFMLRMPSSQQPSRNGHPMTPMNHNPPPTLRTNSRSPSPSREARSISPSQTKPKPPTFHVPDLSDMDPFTLMERGLVEELARFRVDPQGYFEQHVLPDIAVELPQPPEVLSPQQLNKAGAVGLHPALVPRCINDILVRAKELRRRELQRQQELRQVLQREAEFHATHTDMVILGGPQLGPRRASVLKGPTITVPLEAAELYADALVQAVQDIKKGSTLGDDGDASPGKGGKKSNKVDANNPPSPSHDKVTPAHRRMATDLLQRHLDEVETLVADRQAAVVVLRDFNEQQRQERLRNADPETTKKKAAESNSNKPGSSPAPNAKGGTAGKRSRTPSPSRSLNLRDHTPSSDDGFSPRPAPSDKDNSASGAAATAPGLPRVAYIKGLCMAARDLAELLSEAAASSIAAMQAAQGWPGGIVVDDAASPQRTVSNRVPTLTTVEKLSSQYGKVTESITAYIIYGVWHQPQTAVAALLQQWLDNQCHTHPSQVPTASKGAAHLVVGQATDTMLLFPSRINGGAAWQRHATHGAVTVVLLSSGFQEVSYIKQHRNLPVIELRRCFNLGQMGRQERVYDLTFIPEHYEIRPIKPLVHPLVCGRRVEVVVELPRHVLLSCAIESGSTTAQPGRSMSTTFVDRIGKYAKLHAVLMEQSAAKLVVFARHPSELQYRRASTVLLKPSPVLWAANNNNGTEGTEGGLVASAEAPTTSPEGIQLASLAAVDHLLAAGNAGGAVNPSGAAVFPEQFEHFQAKQGYLLCPRSGEVVDASTAAADGADAAASMACLPPGVTLGTTTRAALASGGTLISFRCDVECQQANVIGSHGTTQLYRVPCWGYGFRAELRPRAGTSEPPNLSWFFGVVKVKQGSPVCLWLDGQCALQWTVAEVL